MKNTVITGLLSALGFAILLGAVIYKETHKQRRMYWVQTIYGSSVFGPSVTNYDTDSIISMDKNGVLFIDDCGRKVYFSGSYRVQKKLL